MPQLPEPNILLDIGLLLRKQDYRFVCTTPATHAIVLARAQRSSAGLRDIFGWNRIFDQDALHPDLFGLLYRAELLERCGSQWRSRIRFSTAQNLLLAHSAFPTEERDAVFFGPDTYRFLAYLQRALASWRPLQNKPLRILDLGCGTGAGGLVAASHLEADIELTLSDVNAKALHFAQANAALASRCVGLVKSDLFEQLEGNFDLIVMNPPYLFDSKERSYRHGGENRGLALPLKMVSVALPRLRPGGLLLIYTGTPIVDGHDGFRAGIKKVIPAGMRHMYEEIDPDIFGEELSGPAYADVDRIAAVTLAVEA